MGKRTPPFEPHPEWTQAKFFAWLRGVLRSGHLRWPPRLQAKQLARRRKPKKNKGRHRWEYKCAKCHKHFKDKEVEVDHVESAGSLREWGDLQTFCERLFTNVNGYQVLCKPCHKKKTQEDRRKKE